MGFSHEEIQDSLVNQKYNDVMAAYLLLDYRNSEVRPSSLLPFVSRTNGNTFAKMCFPFSVSQLDEGGIKPRPGSDVSNINAPSPSHKVQ